MKVLFVVPNYEPAWAFGGVVRCLSTLCRAMAQLGVSVTVYTMNIDGLGGLLPAKTGDPVNIGGVTVYYFPSTFGNNSDFDSRALVSMLKQTIRDFTIVYIAATWQWIGIAAARISHSHSIPYVVSTHGAFDKTLLKKKKVKKMLYWYLFLRHSFRNANAIHFTTDYERQQSTLLQNKYPSFVIPNCLQPDAFIVPRFDRESIRKSWKIPEKASVLITVGRPDPKKNIDLLLKSFSDILSTQPNTYLVIVGQYDNAYSRQLMNLTSKLRLTDNVIWTGYKSGDDLKKCYASADVFILPSKDENFGMVVTEAMAMGLPVIVSNHVGVARDILSHDAGIITDVNAQQVAEAMKTLLNNTTLYHKISDNARFAAKELYSGEMVAKLMLTAFNDIIYKKRSSECLWN